MKMQEKLESSTKSKKIRPSLNEKQRFLAIGIIVGFGFAYFFFGGAQTAQDSEYYDKCTQLVNEFITQVNELTSGKDKYTYATVPLTAMQSTLNEFLLEYNESFEQERSGE